MCWLVRISMGPSKYLRISSEYSSLFIAGSQCFSSDSKDRSPTALLWVPQERPQSPRVHGIGMCRKCGSGRCGAMKDIVGEDDTRSQKGRGLVVPLDVKFYYPQDH